MIYLKRELAQFERMKKEFRAACEEVLTRAGTRDAQRGRSADLGSPIHHRMSPEGMAHELAKKGDRIQRKQEMPGWSDDPYALGAIMDDCVDVINYAKFLGALCSMLRLDSAAGAEQQQPSERRRRVAKEESKS